MAEQDPLRRANPFETLQLQRLAEIDAKVRSHIVQLIVLRMVEIDPKLSSDAFIAVALVTFNDLTNENVSTMTDLWRNLHA
jgi:hypothetical protein